MGSLFKTETPAPPPPPPPTYIRDEINRVEQVPVTNPDGSVTYVTREIPKTAEEQAQEDELNRIMQEALGEIEKLSATDYAEDAETRKVLQAWEDEREKVLSTSFASRERETEKVLARRGLSDSSAGENTRRLLQLDKQEAERQVEREKDLLSNDIRQQRIAQQQNLYSLASSQKNADAVRQQQSALAGQSQLIGQNATRQASLLDYYNRQQQGGGNLLGSLATVATTAAGAYYGGPQGAAAGASLGKALFNS